MLSGGLSIISPIALTRLLSDCRTRVIPVDATRNGGESFLNERLPNACFFDLDVFAQPNSPYPQMLPDFEKYNESILQLGIQPSDTLVVYDKEGIISCPRAAWILTLYGHRNVKVLNNYHTYKNSGQALDTSITTTFISPLCADHAGNPYDAITKSAFTKAYPSQVIEYEELLTLVEADKLAREYYTFDARSQGRFDGTAPEPRAGLLSGHIPGSYSLPLGEVLCKDGTFASKQDLTELFASKFLLDVTSLEFLNDKKGIIVSCGSGVTAVILLFAIQVVLEFNVPIRVYDGSWSEWAVRAPTQFIAKK